MLAGNFHAPRKIELVEIDEPQLGETPGQILFQPELACLCGSDLPYFEGDFSEFKPHLGQSLHEMIGTVVDTTGDRFRAGDRVLCVPSDHYGLWERFVAPQRQAIPLDARLEDDLALLAQPLGTVICALRKLPSLINWNVAVVGQGPMGQLFCSALRMAGAREIIAIEPIGQRLAVSGKMGATHCLNPGEVDVLEAVREITDGALCDLVVEVVGHREQQVNACVQLCRPFGKLLLFGVPCATIDNLKIKDLFWKNLTVHTSVAPDFNIDFPLAMRWIAERRLDVSPLITHRFPLAEIQQAFELFHGRRDGALKVYIDFPKH